MARPATRRGAGSFMAWNRPPPSASPPTRRFSPPASAIPNSRRAERRRLSSASHRGESAGAAQGRRLRKRHLPPCCSMSPIASRRRGAAAGRWRRRFRFRSASNSIMASMIWKSRASAMAAIVANRDGGEHRFEIDALDSDSIRFRSNGLAESRHLLPRAAIGFTSASWRHACGPRSHAGRTGRGGGNRQRRQGPRGDEWPRRGGAGQDRRARRRRPAGDDAGSHEDGARA